MTQREKGNDVDAEDQPEMELLEPSSEQRVDNLSKPVPVPPDGGYGWVVVAAGALNMLITLGQMRSFAFIYAKLIDMFQNSTVEIGGIASVWFALQTLIGPVSGVLSEKYGLRRVGMIGSFISCAGMILSAFPVDIPYLYFTISILGGVGASFVFMTSMVAPTKYFKEKRGRAMAVMTLGGSIGIMIYPIITVKLLQTYGYTGTMLIQGAIALNRIPLCFLYRSLQIKHSNTTKPNCLQKRKRTEQNTTHYDISEKSDELSPRIQSDNTETEIEVYDNDRVQKAPPLQARLKSKFDAAGLGIFRNGIFLSKCFFSCTWSFLMSIMMTYITKFAIEINVSQIQISIILTLAGVTDAVGKSVSGFLYDWQYIRSFRVLCYGLTGALTGACTIFMAILARDHILLGVFYLLSMMLWGSLRAQAVTIMSDIVGQEIAKAFGFTIFASGVGFFLGPLVAGALYEAIGAFWGAFLVGGCVFTAGSLILSAVFILRKNKDIERRSTPAASTKVDHG